MVMGLKSRFKSLILLHQWYETITYGSHFVSHLSTGRRNEAPSPLIAHSPVRPETILALGQLSVHSLVSSLSSTRIFILLPVLDNPLCTHIKQTSPPPTASASLNSTPNGHCQLTTCWHASYQKCPCMYTLMWGPWGLNIKTLRLSPTKEVQGREKPEKQISYELSPN